EVFTELVGDGPDPTLKFGWWDRDTKGEQGFLDWGANPLHTLLHDEIKPDSVLALGPLTPELTAGLRERAKTIAADWPFDFGTFAIPAIHLFTFDGKDPAGSLLNHLVEAGDGAPSKTWLKECDRLIGGYGTETVLECFGRWIAHGTVREVPEFD